MRAHPSPMPFHARTVELNRNNAWVARGHFVVPAHYGSAAEEALAARYSVVLADITPQMQLRIQGEGAERLLSAACALSLKELGAGSALPVVWRADGGGVRGIGILARRARDHFVLTSADTDIAWFERASALYGAELHDETQATLQLTGPYAAETLRAAGLEAAIDINELRHEVFEWQGVLVTISRRREKETYRIECSAKDALHVFDRLRDAGRNFALRMAGQEALDLLSLENGKLLPGAYFMPARSDDATEPSAAMLGLGGGQAEHLIVGIEWDGEAPADGAGLYKPVPREDAGMSLLYRVEQPVGAILRSAFSPALSRMIATARLERNYAEPEM